MHLTPATWRSVPTTAIEPTPAEPRRTLQAAAPVALAVLLLLALGAIVVLARRASESDAPAEAGAFAFAATQHTAAWNVERVEGATLTVSGGPQGTFDLALPPATPIEVLEPMAPSEIAPGASLTVVGVPNEVKNFAIRLLVIIPSATEAGDGGVARSPAGFAGHEAARDQKEAPLMGGVVESVVAGQVTVRAPAGMVDVSLTGGAPVSRLHSAPEGYPIRSGDRIAVHLNPDGSPNLAAGILVSTGGAR